jgi:hypothetical protein
MHGPDVMKDHERLCRRAAPCGPRRSARLLFGQLHDAGSLHLEAVLLEVRDDLACFARAEGVGLDDSECLVSDIF